ncbi:c-type cytochrome [Brevibacillus brevis]|uniref:c-type cytochrome n=1 Tax=Brevibacillus brevis TaxID=1393 RepID=UPI0037CC20FA
MTGVTSVYPQYIARSGKILTIEERINVCFQQSMNGKPLPYNRDEMQAKGDFFRLACMISPAMEIMARSYPALFV